jgi:hypothetical protein
MSVEAISPGYALPGATASLSPAAPLARVAALSEPASSHELGPSRAIIDQNNLPCCVSSALAAALEILNAGWPRLAPLFHYYVTRFELGGADPDGFLYLNQSLQTLDRKGICKHDLHHVPFDDAGSRIKPSPAAYLDARTRAFDTWEVFERYRPSTGLSRFVWIKEQLRRGRPVIVGFQLPAAYPQTFLNSIFQWLNPNVTLSRFGHCVLVRGYDDVRQVLHIQDSRGRDAFEQGCWWMGSRVADHNVVQEAYCLTE